VARHIHFRVRGFYIVARNRANVCDYII
jgi:hypothetical protein